MVVAAVIVMSMMIRGAMRLREHDFPDAVPIAAFVGVRRRGRQDAEMRHSEDEKPSQEATKQDHRGILNAGFLPLFEDGGLCRTICLTETAQGVSLSANGRGAKGPRRLTSKQITRRRLGLGG